MKVFIMMATIGLSLVYLLLFSPMIAVSKQDGIKGKMTIEQSAVTLNATATITGTPFYIKENSGFLSVFYDFVIGTSTAHYKIQVYTSPDGTNFVTTPIVITPSSDETSVDMKHVDVPIYVTSYARIDIVGVALNATNTTFTLWRVEQ